MWAGFGKRAQSRLLVSLLLSAGFIWLLHRGGLPMLPDRAAFGALNVWTIPFYLVINLLVTHLRTFRWVHLLHPIAPGLNRFRVLAIGFIGYGAVFLSPLRTGEFVRPYLLSRDRQVTFVQALGVVAGERVIDGLFATLLTLASLALAHTRSPLPNHLGALPIPISAVPAALYSALALFGSALLAMLIFYRARALARRGVALTVGLVSKKLATWVTSTLERLADGLSFLPSRAHLGRFLRDTVVCWVLLITSQWLLLRGLGLPATAAEAGATIGVMSLGTLIPSGPGFFGAYQLATFTGLALFYPADQVLTRGAGFVFIAYCTLLVMNVGSVLVGWWLLRRFPAPSLPLQGR